MRKYYLIYDGRYLADPQKAYILEVCDTLKEARKSVKDYGDDSVIVKVQHDEVNFKFVNKKIIEP
jgi:DNA-directed RNA polymerase subunit E'/Rpb7